jgi:two-component system sensor histidine kinase MtrB
VTDHQPGRGLLPALGRRLRVGSLRLRSLRVRLVAVFAVVALTAAVSASGIAYWLNRDAVLKRAQDTALKDFRVSLSRNVSALPQGANCPALLQLANDVAGSGLGYNVVVVDDAHPDCDATSDPGFTVSQVPKALAAAVARPRPVGEGNPYPYHLYWQRVNINGQPFVVGGTKVVPTGPTAYMFKSLDNERADLNTLGWSLAVATLLALIAATLLAQAASATVLRPVRQLADAARRLGEGKLDTRLAVSGADELADLARTFNSTAEALSEQVEELSAREAQSRRFVADMSHELRTPLTAMTAVTDILEDEAESLDPMIEPAVRLVVSETRRLSDLVENLMEVTRFDAGTAKLVADEMDIADLIMSCIDGRAWYDAVEVDSPRGVLAVVDPRRLDVVFANLIGNALKHGGSPVRVRVTEEPGHVVVRVSDSGPGIPEDVLPHVFDRFYKADKGRARSEGSGLGLSIAMANAQIHGGTITAANSPQGGAVFTLRLPLRPPTPPGEGPKGPQPNGGGDVD